ncbi:hypothetical protein BH11PSE4_BH11PSE4_23870 [soil metagenome]
MPTFLRNTWLPLAAVLAITAAAPAMAADYFVREPAPRIAVMPAPAGPVTLQEALAIAAGIGVVMVQDTHFDDDQWEIEGRDRYGKWIKVEVDAGTGEIRNVDRSIL